MRKYDKYKNTNIEWIGEIPEHWVIKQLRYVSSQISAGGTPSTKVEKYWNQNDYVWLPSGRVQNKEIVITNKEKYISQSGLENSSTKLIDPNTTLIALTGATCGNIGYLTFKACANQSVVSINNNETFDSKFLFYYLLSQREQIRLKQSGGAQGGINTEDVKSLKFVSPSIEEQIQISSYLDNKTSLIDRLINNNKKLIKLLEEKRTALINKVITKGLDPNVKMKDSGIEWIGEIPEHWEVKRLKFLGQIVGGSTPSSSEEAFWDGDINWITTADMGNTKGKYIYKSKRTITKAGLDSIGNKIFPVGSLIISNRAPIGYVFISQLPSATNQGCKTIYDIKGNVDFMYYYLISIRNILESLGKGTTFKELSDTSLESIKVPFPSQLEQNKIVEYLDKKTSCIDETINKVKDENKLLREYRASLISNVVTGKIKVNNL